MTENTWTDWRGNDYAKGTLILYARMSGRSCEMAEGVVKDLYEVYYGDDYTWHKLAPGETAPEHEVHRWKNTETGEVSKYNMQWHRQNGEPWVTVEVTEPRETERRAKILPTNRTSRFGGYWNKKWVYDEEAGKGDFIETEQKPITLKVTESITVPLP